MKSDSIFERFFEEWSQVRMAVAAQKLTALNRLINRVSLRAAGVRMG
jgi:hypothetical protein